VCCHRMIFDKIIWSRDWLLYCAALFVSFLYLSLMLWIIIIIIIIYLFFTKLINELGYCFIPCPLNFCHAYFLV
jgi:hypothetical protein